MKKKKIIREKPKVSIPGLRVKCSACRSWVAKCGVTGDDLAFCPHQEKLSFLGVVHVSGTQHGRVIRELGTDLETAIARLNKLKTDVRDGKIGPKFRQKKSTAHAATVNASLHHQEQSGEITLIEAMTKYIGFLNNVDTPKHRQRERSTNYKNDVGRAFKYMCGCIQLAGDDASVFQLSKLSDREVGLFYEEMIDRRHASPFTYNRYLSHFSTFCSWAIKRGYNVKNVFDEDVQRLDTHSESKAITEENFERLLTVVNHENGFVHTPGKKKTVRNVFRNYLITAYRIGLLSGRRTEECINFSFSDLDDNCKTIRVEDFKPNRIKNRQGLQKRFVYVPVTPQFRILLDELGYDQFKRSGENRFLIAPEILENRVTTISNALSRSFTHYYKQLDGEVLTWKCLRKTHLSALRIFLNSGGNQIQVRDISNHSSDAILDKHYYDQQMISSAIADSGFEVFPNRGVELLQIRTKSKDAEHNSIEK